MRSNDAIKTAMEQPYKEGFETLVDSETFAPGLDEDVVRRLSALRSEPDWLLDFRLSAFERWKSMREPTWADLRAPSIDYQAMSYHSAPKAPLTSIDQVAPEILATFEKLGIPLAERAALAGVAVDAVFDSTSVASTFKARLAKVGVIFCPFSVAAREHPELLRQYLGSVVPASDNFYAALNSAVFSDGSFVFIPKGVVCPMELSTYFRINARNTGQFERTLIVAEEGASVSYLEGCSAPAYSEHQLHAAVVEIVALADARVKYSTVQNWYPGDDSGAGGILNYVTKRGECRGDRSRISWTQVETGSSITWKYPSVVLRGDDSVGEFSSIALSHRHQQADTGTKMIHMGKRTRSMILSKGISAGQGRNSYRGLVRILPGAEGAKNNTRCDSLLIGADCEANTYPEIDSRRWDATIEHEASVSQVSERMLHLLASRGIGEQEAVSLIVAGFCKEVIKDLPMEFAVEAQRLLGVSLEGAVG